MRDYKRPNYKRRTLATAPEAATVTGAASRAVPVPQRGAVRAVHALGPQIRHRYRASDYSKATSCTTHCSCYLKPDFLLSMEMTITNAKQFLPGLEAVLDDESVAEVMINGPVAAIVNRAGRFTVLAWKPRH